jgi:hypothetical protein
MERPVLTFACELPADSLVDLFDDEAVIDHLAALEAKVSLGILELSPERATVVQKLNAAGVPVVAWLLLPKSQGYWFNADNGPQAVARYAAFQLWTAEHGLVWDGIGVDIEPDIQVVESLVTGNAAKVLPRLLRNAFDRARVARAQAIYATLITQMGLDGYCVESYQFPFIVDERMAGSQLLQRLLGVVDVPADREVLMVYTSFMRSAGPGLLWSYGRDAPVFGGGVAVGSTGGGVEIDQPPTLTWIELVRDLRLAHQWGDEIFVFSLEGCVERDYLRRLGELDWDVSINLPLRQARRVDVVRRAARGLLWASARPSVVLSGLALVVALACIARRRRRSE